MNRMSFALSLPFALSLSYAVEICGKGSDILGYVQGLRQKMPQNLAISAAFSGFGGLCL